MRPRPSTGHRLLVYPQRDYPAHAGIGAVCADYGLFIQSYFPHRQSRLQRADFADERLLWLLLLENIYTYAGNAQFFFSTALLKTRVTPADIL